MLRTLTMKATSMKKMITMMITSRKKTVKRSRKSNKIFINMENTMKKKGKKMRKSIRSNRL